MAADFDALKACVCVCRSCVPSGVPPFVGMNYISALPWDF